MLLSLALLQYGCAVTGPRVTRQEEEAARGQIKQADYRIWWTNQKRLLRVTDRFAWRVQAPEAPYRNAFGILPVLRKSASPDELALFEALGSPRDGTVLHVSAGSPGEIAGVSEGDQIVAIGNRSITTLTKEDLVKFAATRTTENFELKKRGQDAIATVRISPAPVLDITFFVLRSPDVQADAGPTNGVNVIRVYYGMLNLVQSDDELASVMGHEITHILKDHYGKKSTISGISSLIGMAVILAGAAKGVDLSDGVNDLKRIAGRAFSRDYEREADYLGLYITQQAGFDISAAISYWERMGSVVPQLTANYLSTHPSTPERFVRIQKTIEEIRQGRTLQEVWNGEFSETQLASNNSQRPTTPPGNTGSVASTAYSPTITPAPSTPTPVKDGNIKPPATVASLTSSPAMTVSLPPEQKPITKTYASLVQYDGPKIKSGVTLDAQFIDDGSGSGEGLVNDIANHLLKGTFTTVKPGARDRPQPKILDRATLNKLQILSDRPWVFSSFSNGDTVLECVYGETRPLGQKKGECRDNNGNRYHVNLLP